MSATMCAFQLPCTIQVADGTMLHVSEGGGQAALSVAEDEDWAECLIRARLAIVKGAKSIDADATWEEGLAAVASWYLRKGTGEPAMGRTPDEGEWAEQAPRWVELVFAEAAKGPGGQARRYQQLNVEDPRLLDRNEAEALAAGGGITKEKPLAPVWVPDPNPRVLTTRGWMPFGDVLRWGAVEDGSEDAGEGAVEE